MNAIWIKLSGVIKENFTFFKEKMHEKLHASLLLD